MSDNIRGGGRFRKKAEGGYMLVEREGVVLEVSGGDDVGGGRRGRRKGRSKEHGEKGGNWNFDGFRREGVVGVRDGGKGGGVVGNGRMDGSRDVGMFGRSLGGFALSGGGVGSAEGDLGIFEEGDDEWEVNDVVNKERDGQDSVHGSVDNKVNDKDGNENMDVLPDDLSDVGDDAETWAAFMADNTRGTGKKKRGRLRVDQLLDETMMSRSLAPRRKTPWL